MKCDQKITRIQLKVNPSEDISFFGIVSSEPDYKLSLILNKQLRISLKNISPLTINSNEGIPVTFSRFSWMNSTTDETCSLVSNRSGKNFLIRGLHNIDYIFQFQDHEGTRSIERITSILKGIESITALFIIDSKSIKDKDLQYLIH